MSALSQASAPGLLLAGASPGGHAGNSVSTEVLYEALATLADVTLLTHQVSALPSWRENETGDRSQIVVGTQPLLVHAEAMPAGLLHRGRLRGWQGAWAVNSRYAGALYAARVPYVIWEATTLRDEIGASSLMAVRRSGRGTGLGRVLHRSLLPVDDRVERALYERAVAVLAMSPYTRDRIIEQHGIPPDRVRVLPHPPSRGYREMVDTKLREGHASRQGGTWRLLFVGRADDPRKDPALLFRAVRRLRAEGRQVEVLLVGPYNDSWRSRLSLDGVADAVTFAGPVSLERLVDAYLTHDVLIVPSRQEGFGIVVAEAFAAGLPVISTRCGGPEHIIRESEAGMIVNHHEEALASAIREVMSTPERRIPMRQRALAYAGTALAFSRFAGQVKDISEELLGVR